MVKYTVRFLMIIALAVAFGVAGNMDYDDANRQYEYVSTMMR